MQRDELGDLIGFLAVAEERSFTRAAARIGTSQSSLSHTIRRLEERMGVRLLTRTTRNVAPTEAGEQLAQTLRPAFNEIRARLDSITALRQKPAGAIRITSSRHATETILMPAAMRLMADYPDIMVEISIEGRLTDLVAERYDAGVRLGERVEKDMIAIKIGPELRMAVVGSPDYFARNPKPATPHDLTQHVCINLRLPTLGGLYAWEFENNGRPLNVRVDGQFTCNDAPMIVRAAVNGLGLACLPDDQFDDLIAQGRLIRVLEDWCPPFPGYHLYYPSRRQVSPAFELFVEALRTRG
ncbi:DNA-binding transcriptional regulator, LysR family [Rhodoblastus acidophilus]|uniref:DNA-binding transcriptional regulator, LysR family n=1 Tax=Rhodoblastus acidophilus TaxID=1074 RepID=A0A212S8H6_RHOAC|nr:LysR family transcriptional regulator [Rhodoblastus acidophilus]PPQ36824.1 LysR family transcriptional regulator [Rhodoblastus acidophilus]RAI21410.1 LysR family transcriptional regulator [Rhodoblastus acidophilus]SNB81673.1 DNA-binding transcriptional regulator, LysR family [Rhodoblastus acidophilus]